MKYCKKCRQTKEYIQFSNNKRSKDGYQIYCKECNKRDNKKDNDRRREFGPTIFRNEKFCNDCKQYKKIEKFGKKTSSADGYQSYCKLCWRDRVRRAKSNSTASL